MKPIDSFQSPRLEVWHFQHNLDGPDYLRDVFIGWPEDCGCPYPVAMLVVLEDRIEMINVIDLARREGYGTAILRSVENYLGRQLCGSPVTDAGEAFSKACEIPEWPYMEGGCSENSEETSA